LEQRYTKYLLSIEKKLLDGTADAAADATTTTTTNRKPELLCQVRSA
jgi:hypothetical protein